MTTNKLTYDPPSRDTGWCFIPETFTVTGDWKSRREVRIIDLPVGAHVSYDKFGQIGDTSVHASSLVGTVGKPEVLEDGTIVCKYRDIAGEWDYVEPETRFFLVGVCRAKKLSCPARTWLTDEAATPVVVDPYEIALEDCVL